MTYIPQQEIRITNAADYREHYANSVQVRVNVWDFFLVFGTLQPSETHVDGAELSGHLSEPAAGQGAGRAVTAKRRQLRADVRGDQTRPEDGARAPLAARMFKVPEVGLDGALNPAQDATVGSSSLQAADGRAGAPPRTRMPVGGRSGISARTSRTVSFPVAVFWFEGW